MKKCGRQEEQEKEGTNKRKVTDEVEKGKEEGKEKQRTLKLNTQKTEELLCCCWELGS